MFSHNSIFPVVFALGSVGVLFSGNFGKAPELPPKDAILHFKAEGGIGIGQFSKTKQQGDEVITIQFIDKDGKRVTATAKTGDMGSSHTGDDIKKGATKEEKAERIKEAINSDLAGQVRATRTGFVLTVEAIPPNKGIDQFKVTNNTREKKNKTEIVYPAGTFDVQKNLGSQPVYVGRIIMIGGIQGVDDDGLPATVTVGTDRWEKEWSTSQFNDLETMISSIVQDLLAHGIQASLENSNSIKIVLDPSSDVRIVYGNTDVAIHQMASIGTE